MTYVMSDLHGNYQKFLAMLEQISFGEEDILYFVGDLVDYGDEPMELLADVSVRLNVYPVAGEHDYRAVRMLKGFDQMLKSGAQPDAEYIAEMTEWVKNGGQTTLDAFRALDADAREGVLEYLEEMPLFEEAEAGGKNYLLVHAGIAGFHDGDDPDEYLPEDFFSEPLDPKKRLTKDATVIVGHVPTATGKIERGAGSIFLDCGAGTGGKLGCLCLETGTEYYV